MKTEELVIWELLLRKLKMQGLSTLKKPNSNQKLRKMEKFASFREQERALKRAISVMAPTHSARGTLSQVRKLHRTRSMKTSLRLRAGSRRKNQQFNSSSKLHSPNLSKALNRTFAKSKRSRRNKKVNILTCRTIQTTWKKALPTRPTGAALRKPTSMASAINYSKWLRNTHLSVSARLCLTEIAIS